MPSDRANLRAARLAAVAVLDFACSLQEHEFIQYASNLVSQFDIGINRHTLTGMRLQIASIDHIFKEAESSSEVLPVIEFDRILRNLDGIAPASFPQGPDSELARLVLETKAQACVDVVRRQQHNDTPVGDMQAEFKEVFMRHFPDDDDDATSADYRKELGVVLRPTSSSEEFSQVISRFNLDQYRREITQLLQQVLNHLGHGYLTQQFLGPWKNGPLNDVIRLDDVAEDDEEEEEKGAVSGPDSQGVASEAAGDSEAATDAATRASGDAKGGGVENGDEDGHGDDDGGHDDDDDDDGEFVVCPPSSDAWRQDDESVPMAALKKAFTRQFSKEEWKAAVAEARRARRSKKHHKNARKTKARAAPRRGADEEEEGRPETAAAVAAATTKVGKRKKKQKKHSKKPKASKTASQPRRRVVVDDSDEDSEADWHSLLKTQAQSPDEFFEDIQPPEQQQQQQQQQPARDPVRHHHRSPGRHNTPKRSPGHHKSPTRGRSPGYRQSPSRRSVSRQSPARAPSSRRVETPPLPRHNLIARNLHATTAALHAQGVDPIEQTLQQTENFVPSRSRKHRRAEVDEDDDAHATHRHKHKRRHKKHKKHTKRRRLLDKSPRARQAVFYSEDEGMEPEEPVAYRGLHTPRMVVVSALPKAATPRAPTPGKQKRRRRWSAEEEEQLRRGVSEMGAGCWKEILQNFEFDDRTTVNLKDKWRNMLKAGTAYLN